MRPSKKILLQNPNITGVTRSDNLPLSIKSIIGIANFIAINEWLQTFAYRISVEGVIFLLSCGLTLIITFLTVSFQTIKAAIANPVDSLRYE